MATRAKWVCVVILAGVIACGDDDDGSASTSEATNAMPTSTQSADDGSSAPMTMSTAMTAGDDDGDGDGASQTAGDDDGGPSTGPADDTMASTAAQTTEPADSGTADGGAVCDEQTDPCFQCVAEACCNFWTECQNDPGCACVLDCHVIEGGSLGGCESQCDHDGEL